MRGNAYQDLANRTLIPEDNVLDTITRLVLGLLGEAGEFANKYKKVFRDNNGELTAELRQHLVDELGDQLWYIAVLCTLFGYDLEVVMANNVNKLHQREKLGKIQGVGDHRGETDWLDLERRVLGGNVENPDVFSGENPDSDDDSFDHYDVQAWVG